MAETVTLPEPVPPLSATGPTGTQEIAATPPEEELDEDEPDDEELDVDPDEDELDPDDEELELDDDPDEDELELDEEEELEDDELVDPEPDEELEDEELDDEVDAPDDDPPLPLPEEPPPEQAASNSETHAIACNTWVRTIIVITAPLEFLSGPLVYGPVIATAAGQAVTDSFTSAPAAGGAARPMRNAAGRKPH